MLTPAAPASPSHKDGASHGRSQADGARNFFLAPGAVILVGRGQEQDGRTLRRDHRGAEASDRQLSLPKEVVEDVSLGKPHNQGGRQSRPLPAWRVTEGKQGAIQGSVYLGLERSQGKRRTGISSISGLVL